MRDEHEYNYTHRKYKSDQAEDAMQGIRQIDHATLYRLSLTHQPADLTTNAVLDSDEAGIARRSDRKLRIACNYILRKRGNTNSSDSVNCVCRLADDAQDLCHRLEIQ
jgi:hypothetical protein